MHLHQRGLHYIIVYSVLLACLLACLLTFYSTWANKSWLDLGYFQNFLSAKIENSLTKPSILVPRLSFLVHLNLTYWIAGQAYAEFFEDLVVHFAQHHGGVYLATVEFGQLFQSAAAVVVVDAQD